jgi:putative ABC transport system permease protein
MINNYLKTAWRSMRTQVSTTAINVLGLAMGLAVSMLIFLWVADEYNYDRFHTQLPQLYRVMRNFKEGEGKIWTTSSHSALM